MQVSPTHSPLICIAAAILAMGCTSGATSRPPAPTPPPARKSDSTAAIAKPMTWSLRHAPGTWRYEARSSAIITPTSDTSAAAVPVHSTIRYTVTLDTAGQGFSLTGSVDSVVVMTGGKIPAPQTMKAPYAQFTGELSPSGKLDTLQTAAQSMCPNGIDPFIAGVHGLFVAFPPTVMDGTSWNDTVTTVTCRGELPITTTTARNYRVVGETMWQGEPALEIAQSGTITVSSQTTVSNGAAPTVAGSGNSSATLRVDPSTGILLSVTGESHITVTITERGSTLPFRQDVADTVTLQR